MEGFVTMRTFIKMNRYYDNTKEPLRFFTAMAVMWLPVAISCVIAFLLSNNMISTTFTCIWLFILIFVRTFWVSSSSSNRREKLKVQFLTKFKEDSSFHLNDPLPAEIKPYEGRLSIQWENGCGCVIDASYINIYKKI